MSKLLIFAFACLFILSWSNRTVAQNISDSCKVSFMDMVEDDITDLGSFTTEIGADKLTIKTFRISSNLSPKWSFVTVGVGYHNPGVPKDITDINEIGFTLIVSNKVFKQLPDFSIESSLLSNLDAALAYVPMKSFDRIEVSKNVIGRDGRLLIVTLECERKIQR